jgi:nitrite reductase (NADH) large subunit
MELAEDAQVGNCNGVSTGQLVACVRDGQHTVNGVMAASRAGRSAARVGTWLPTS